jgi:hypothetical protein
VRVSCKGKNILQNNFALLYILPSYLWKHFFRTVLFDNTILPFHIRSFFQLYLPTRWIDKISETTIDSGWFLSFQNCWKNIFRNSSKKINRIVSTREYNDPRDLFDTQLGVNFTLLYKLILEKWLNSLIKCLINSSVHKKNKQRTANFNAWFTYLAKKIRQLWH